MDGPNAVRPRALGRPRAYGVRLRALLGLPSLVTVLEELGARSDNTEGVNRESRRWDEFKIELFSCFWFSYKIK